MGDILEHWEQRVVVVVPGDLCLDHQHSDLLHLQVLLIDDEAVDPNIAGLNFSATNTSGRKGKSSCVELNNCQKVAIRSYTYLVAELSWMELGFI